MSDKPAGQAIETDSQSSGNSSRHIDGEYFKFSTAYLLYFIAAGLYLPYFPSYLNSRGLSGPSIGWLLALAPLMRTIVPPLLGTLADRFRGTNFWSMLIAVGAAICLMLVALSDDRRLLAAGLLGYFICTAPAISLLDASVIHYLQRTATRFGYVRLWGSVGFVLTSFGLGLIYPKLPGNVIIISLVGAQLLFAFFILVASFRNIKPKQPDWQALPLLLQNRRLGLLLLVLFLNRVSSAPYNGFYTLFVQESGHSGEVVAWTWGIGVSAEVVMMLIVDRFIDNFRFSNVLAFGVVLEATRWTVLGLFNTKFALLMVAPVHGIAFATLYVASVRGLAEIVPDDMRALGQGLGAAATGLGQMLGFIIAGYLHQASGNRVMFLCAGLIGLIAFANAALLGRMRGEKSIRV